MNRNRCPYCGRVGKGLTSVIGADGQLFHLECERTEIEMLAIMDDELVRQCTFSERVARMVTQ